MCYNAAQQMLLLQGNPPFQQSSTPHLIALLAGKHRITSEQVAALESTVRKCQARMEELCLQNDKLVAERTQLKEQWSKLKVQQANANAAMESQKQQVGCTRPPATAGKASCSSVAVEAGRQGQE